MGRKTGRTGGWSPQVFIAFRSPGLTQGLTASQVSLRAPSGACRGTLRTAAAGQAGEQTSMLALGKLSCPRQPPKMKISYQGIRHQEASDV